VVVPVLGHDAVLEALSAAAAIDHVRDAFAAHHAGAWTMPSKVYLEAPPYGDFRAMPALGGGFAMLKWISSFPGNPAAYGLPTVMGVVCLSDAGTSAPRMLLDARAVTALRTGAVAAVAAQALARPAAATVGIVGCGLHGAWAARCLAAAGYGPGACFDVESSAATSLAAELGWSAADRAEAASQDVVVTVTPGDQPVLLHSDLRPGQHVAALGADAHGKSEVELEAFAGMRCFCDEWEQASSGGELAAPVAAGRLSRHDVTEIGDVLTGTVPGRRSGDEVTLFDSTGLAIQDLAIAQAVLDAWREGRIEAGEISL
jgi:alanine dehydrogenase